MSRFTRLHAHEELPVLKEPVSESKKVTDFLVGIRDLALSTCRSIVLGDPAKLVDFEECQQYLSTVVQNMSAQTKAERHVLSAMTERSGKGSLIDKIKGGAYSDEQYRSLSSEDKRCFQIFCDEAKKKKKDEAKQRKDKRMLAKLRAKNESGSGDNETESAVGAPS
jgi:hypothetical protein